MSMEVHSLPQKARAHKEREQGWLQDQLAVCSLPRLPAFSGMFRAPPVRQWGFTNIAQVAEAQLALVIPASPSRLWEGNLPWQHQRAWLLGCVGEAI